MDRRRALEIFGLREDASKETIIKRYNVLFKKIRYMEDAGDMGFTRDELEEAYKLLMDIAYHDPEEERRKLARQQHPNPILKALGIDQDKLSNFIYYNKWKFIVGALVLIFVIYAIVSITSRVDPDFKLIIAGEIYVEDIEATEQALKTLVDIKEPQAQHIPISDRLDPQSQSVYEQKLSVEIMAGNNDVFIVDLNLYKRLAPFGIFVPLDDRLDELGIDSYDEQLLVALQTEDGESVSPRLYGVDVTGSRFLDEQGIEGERLIAVIMANAEHADDASEFIKKLAEAVQ
ncbi:MAG TPA: hypothetical protein PL099_03935 [Thermoclostridium caenicola]|nr:hypothetical protein [Thermoclostridium caenicola]